MSLPTADLGHHRVACVDVPALPLQLVARAHPEWADAPLAVVEEDHPQARILMVDARAAEQRVRAGMRYATGLQVSRHLRAAPVPRETLEAAERALLVALQARTPRVEPDSAMPGVYWLDPSGLRGLFGPLHEWALHVHGALTTQGLVGAVVVGFARLPSWAIARGTRGAHVLASPAEEAERAGRAPLSRLDVDPELRDALHALGVTRLGGFLRLPRGEVGLRFGPAARALHARLADAMRDPMQPAPFEEPLAIEAQLEPPTDDAHRLLFCVKGALHALMGELRGRALALSALTLRFDLEPRGESPRAHEERVEPATATRDELAVLELVRLRVASVALPAPVEQVTLTAEPAPLDGAQLTLFGGRRRDPTEAQRGIARLRAAFGDEAVRRARLANGWLPENRFRWEPTREVDAPRPRGDAADDAGLVRRLLSPPRALDTGSDGRPRTRPPLTELTGPYRLQGGWWAREAARDYFFGEREDGALLWLFRDRAARRWFVHAIVD